MPWKARKVWVEVLRDENKESIEEFTFELQRMRKPMPIIDLFAGPGGLGEGFSSLVDPGGTAVFEKRLSIEMDTDAVHTLTWRAFFKKIVASGDTAIESCYKILRTPSLPERERKIEELLNTHPLGVEAREEIRQIELGSDKWPAENVDKIISSRLNGARDWLLIGGPPCQAYSNAGRSRVGGISKSDHRVYLYEEYLRIIEKHRPSLFVMENVQGLLSAKVDGQRVFDWIKKDLVLSGDYRLYSFVGPVTKDSDFLIKSENYGIPQTRHRVIIFGLRKDYVHSNDFLKPSEQIELGQVIGDLPEIRSGLSKSFVGLDTKNCNKLGRPKAVYDALADSFDLWKETMEEAKKMLAKTDLAESVCKLQVTPKTLGSEFHGARNRKHKSNLGPWFSDVKLKGVLNHQSRFHLKQDLHRYLFAAVFSKKHKSFPRMADYQSYGNDLLPVHRSATTGKFTDRFRVQLKDKPATTVTSHISKDGHYFIHYDPEQMRSLTVREAARIQTFPDNYLFRGSRTRQFHQVGNAVPPFLAYQMAKVVKQVIDFNTQQKQQ